MSRRQVIILPYRFSTSPTPSGEYLSSNSLFFSDRPRWNLTIYLSVSQTSRFTFLSYSHLVTASNPSILHYLSSRSYHNPLLRPLLRFFIMRYTLYQSRYLPVLFSPRLHHFLCTIPALTIAIGYRNRLYNSTSSTLLTHSIPLTLTLRIHVSIFPQPSFDLQ